ncbi:hypothetical protein Trydic_g7202 [Trypoxylus dichotomus]
MTKETSYICMPHFLLMLWMPMVMVREALKGYVMWLEDKDKIQMVVNCIAILNSPNFNLMLKHLRTKWNNTIYLQAGKD